MPLTTDSLHVGKLYVQLNVFGGCDGGGGGGGDIVQKPFVQVRLVSHGASAADPQLAPALPSPPSGCSAWSDISIKAVHRMSSRPKPGSRLRSSSVAV